MIELFEIESPLSEGFAEIRGRDVGKLRSSEGTMLTVLAYAIAASVTLLFLLPRLGGATVTGDSVRWESGSASAEQTGSVESGNGDDVARVAGAAVQSLSSAFSPEVLHWAPQILAWSEMYEVDPDIVAIIMQVESCGDPQAVSSAGASGLFQVMPFHFQDGEDSFDPDTNAMRGLRYFADRLVQTGGDVGRAFAGYNGGHVAAAANWEAWANETQRYYTWTTGLYSDVKAGLSESPTLERWMNAGGASLCRQAAERIGL